MNTLPGSALRRVARVIPEPPAASRGLSAFSAL
jgi:hypothetical protein